MEKDQSRDTGRNSFRRAFPEYLSGRMGTHAARFPAEDAEKAEESGWHLPAIMLFGNHS